MNRVRTKRGLALVATAALALTAAGCGDDDEESGGESAEPRRLAIELTGSGEQRRLSVPKLVEGGPTRIEFKNSTKAEAGAQLIRVDAGHTPREGLEASGAWADGGRPLPRWVHLAGGVGNAAPGATVTATQELPPGQYLALDIESETDATFEVEVEGEGGGAELPSPAARINATEYTFNTVGLTAGRQRILFDNKGGEPHFAEALRIKEGKTIADVREFARTEKGEPPIVEERGLVTAVLDGGSRQTIEFDLEPGKYALLCFIPDRKGGPPHVAKGMVSQAVVR